MVLNHIYTKQAAVKKAVAKTCSDLGQSLSCQKVEVDVHPVRRVLGFFSSGRSSFSCFWTLCPSLANQEQGRQGAFPSSLKCSRRAVR